MEAGDYAVQWAFFYYTKEVKNLLGTRQKMMEKIILEANSRGIDLSTPVLNRFETFTEKEPIKSVSAQLDT